MDQHPTNSLRMYSIFILLCVLSLKHCAAQCPITECTCTTITGNSDLAIDCSDRNLNQIPTIQTVSEEYHTLTLADNSITAIPAGAFSNLKVKKIDFARNPLTQVDDRAFEGLESRLEILILDGVKPANPANAPPFTALQNLTKLNTLELEYFQIKTIGDTSFPDMPSLRRLKLQAMGIETIFPNAFFSHFPLLETLMIMGNFNLKIVPTQSFRLLTALKHLTLQNNEIKKISFQAFNSLTSLTELDLSNNVIDSLDPQAFDGLYGKLEVLLLSLNSLNNNSISNLAGHPWTKLHQLNLHLNPLTSIPDNLFEAMIDLAYLNLGETQLSEITKDTFKGTFKLNHLDISYNPLRTIADDAFSSTILNELDLQDLNIDLSTGTGISKAQINITAATFQGIETTLKYLKLSNTAVIEGSGFWSAIGGLTASLYLELNNIGITSIPSCLFNDFTHLESLQLRGNRITTVTQETFSGLETTLVTLDMQNNNIQNIDECLIKNMGDQFKYLYLQDNPIHCDCNVIWYRDQFSLNGGLQYFWNIRCATPNNLANRKLENVSKIDLTCAAGTDPITCKSIVKTCEVVTTTTLRPLPLITIGIVSSEINAIKISWTISYESLLDSYSLTYEKLGGQSIISNPIPIAKSKTEFSQPGLESNTNYEICLTAMLTDNRQTSPRCISSSTKVDPNSQGTTDATTGSDSNTTTIIGAVVGVVVALVIVAIIVYLLVFRRKKSEKELPSVQFRANAYTPDSQPRESDNARRWVKTKPQQNGARASNDIQINTVSGKMHPDDPRVSAGSYQSLKGATSVNLEPFPQHKHVDNPAKSSNPGVSAGHHRYANMKGQTSGPHYINDPKNHQRLQNAKTADSYSNDIENRSLPQAPFKKGAPQDTKGYTNKGYKADTSLPSPSSSANPNVYDEIPL